MYVIIILYIIVVDENVVIIKYSVENYAATCVEFAHSLVKITY